MELTGEHRIAAPRRAVWEALHDPALLAACIKGCKRLEMTAADRMAATVEAKVGPVKATFDADIAIENSVPPESYRLSGEGKGGVAGFAKGFADVSLAEDGADATIMTYRAEAKIGGKLAQLGSRLVDTTARKYATDFFDAFSARLNTAAPVTAAVAGTDTSAVPTPPYAGGERADDFVPVAPLPVRPGELAAADARVPVAAIATPPVEIKAASVPPSGSHQPQAARTQPTVAAGASAAPPQQAGGSGGIVLVVVVIAAIAAGAFYFLS